ncbi:MAG: DUF951 domain-containing protein [Clostridiaceae bacterium]|nr:DUF951 domain-containing protein [Clostridiaceae bacterium]
MPSRFYLYPFKVGEILHLKKQHPCGGWLWQVQRTGADIGLVCTTCGHLMNMPRQKLEKAMESVQPVSGEPMMQTEPNEPLQAKETDKDRQGGIRHG